jgi:uncharacterized membrane protein YccC
MARARSSAAQKDILSRVSELGSEALHRLTEIPGGSRLVEMANESKTRLDEMQKKLRGLDELEKRVAKLEQQVAAQSKPSARKPAAKKPAARKTAAKKPAAKKPS